MNEMNFVDIAQNPAPEITKEQVYRALTDVYDPEIPVNVVDLGLIYGVTIVDTWVGVKMTLTSPGCGLADQIAGEVLKRVKAIPGVTDGDVRIVWNPPWDRTRMSEEAKKKLLLGI